MRRFGTLLLGLLAFASAPGLAGDEARFLTLGWSPDYRYYAFAQYGVEDGSGFPYAQIYLVDVPKNDFVSGGVLKRRLEDEGDYLRSGVNVLLSLRLEADSLFRVLGIRDDVPYVQLVAPATGLRDSVSWRYPAGGTISLVCRQRSQGRAWEFNVKSAFHLELTLNANPPLLIGNSRRFRKGVIRYGIDRVLSDPQQSVYVIVIKKQELGFEGPSIRYMVETVRVE